MGFQLRIVEGQDVGRVLDFAQDAVLIGRGDACDVLLHDAGVSRRHCRILREEDGRYLLEDLGSANGTLLNGEPATRAQLEDGDELALGDAVFTFAAVPAADSTRILDRDALARTRQAPLPRPSASPARPPRTRADAPASAAPSRAGAAASSALARAVSHGALAHTSEPDALARGSGPDAADGPEALAAPERAAARPPPRPRAEASPRLTAAQRARLRRSLPAPLARARLLWLEARPPVRRAVAAGAALLGAALVALLVWGVLAGRSAAEARGAEPSVLGTRPLADSFGLGEGVKWERPDMKVFTWEYTAATRAVVLLHLQAQGVSPGELVVTVNGVDVGQVPADRLNSQERALELRVPPELLKKGQPNRITFDNTLNPPGEDPWRIWNLWVETALLPELPAEQLLSAAREAAQRGEKLLQAADIGAGNRYGAWRAFREAWLLMEAHPEPRPALHLEARDRVREAQAQLDRTCARLLLAVERDLNHRDLKSAAAALDQFADYFPGYDQPCRARAERTRAEHGL